MALGTRTKFQLKILIMNVISGIVYFRDIISESLQNPPRGLTPHTDMTAGCTQDCYQWLDTF